MPENTPVEIGISCLSNMLFPANCGGMTRYVVLGNELIRIGVRVSRLVPNTEIFLYYPHFEYFVYLLMHRVKASEYGIKS